MTTITPLNLNGWVLTSSAPDATVTLADGPGTPPAGLGGSAHFSMDSDPGSATAQLSTNVYGSIELADIFNLSYSTYAETTAGAPYLVLNVDYVGDGAADDQLIFDPHAQTGFAAGTWQTWDTLSGTAKWWSVDQGAQQTFSLADYFEFANAQIVDTDGVSLRTGGLTTSNWANVSAAADLLQINTETNDFDIFQGGWTFNVGDSAGLINAFTNINNNLRQAEQIYTINITANFTLAEDIINADLFSSSRVLVNGNGHTISGANTYNGFVATSGSWQINNLTLANMRAVGANGGDGSSGYDATPVSSHGGDGSGGGGAGLGGGLFVGANASVTLTNVSFSANSAVGGNGGTTPTNVQFTNGGGGGGGGLNGGDGFDGAPANGPNTTIADNSAFVPPIAQGGGGGAPGWQIDNSTLSGGGGGIGYQRRHTNGFLNNFTDPVNGADGNDGGYGGGGGGGGKAARAGGDGGLTINNGNGGFGGDGGFGAGGGGGGSTAGLVDAGGVGGNGGFGGGGGGGGQHMQDTFSSSGGQGGFGAGDGREGRIPTGQLNDFDGGLGGGGLGAGGAIFVQQGGTLVVTGGSISGGSVQGGIGGNDPTAASGNGQGLGSGIFIQGNQSLTLGTNGGTTLTISDVIADMTGSGGTGGDAGAGSLILAGPGTVALTGTNTFSGGIVVTGGYLSIATNAGAGSGTSTIDLRDGTGIFFTDSMTLTHAVKVAGDPLFDVAAGEIVTISSQTTDGTVPGDVEKDGLGTLVLTNNTNNYSGGTILLAGTLELRAVNAAGTNFIRFTAGSETLEIENSALSSNSFGNTIDDFGAGDRIDLSGVSLSAGATYSYTGTTLTIVSGGQTYTLALTDPAATTFTGINNGSSGTAVILNAAAPSFTSGTTASVVEGTLTSTTVYTAVATDTEGAIVTYAITGGADAARFTINSTTGAVRFAAVPNFEAPVDAGPDNVYNIIVQARDGSLTTDLAVAITVTNVAPTFSSGATPSVNEAVAAGTTVYTAAAADPAGGAVTYSLVAGGDASAFSINSSNGVVTINSTPDFETKNSYSFTVQASDGTLTSTRAVTLSVNDLAPVISSGGTAAVDEAVAAGSTVYTAAAADPAGGTVTYALAAGGDAAAFSINSSSGAVTINNTPDYEAKNSYSFTVQASDGTLTSTRAVTLSVNDLAPVMSSGGTAAVDEAVAAGSTVYTAAATDPAGGTVTYSLAAGGDAAAFLINFSNGVVTINSTPDFETKNSYSFTVQASDGTLTSTQAVTLSVNDLAPVISSGGTAAAVDEAVAAGTTVYTAAATDPAGGTVTYALAAGGDAAAFLINSSNGVVTINNTPDYETKNSYSFTVQASDGTLASTQAVTLNVNDLAPVFLSATVAAAVAENTSTSTVVYTAAADDPAGGTVTYALAGTDAAALSINASTGAVTFNASPNFEVKSSYSFNVNASDPSGAFTTQAATVSVTNVDEAPALVATAQNAIFTEDGAAANLFSAATASTIDAGQTFASMTLTVTNVTDGANEVLRIDGSDLALTHGNTVAGTATNGLTVNVAVAGTTATVSFAGASVSAAALQTLVAGLSYRNASQDPTDADRAITIRQLVDSGSNVGPAANATALNIAATVDVNPVNDAPVATDDVLSGIVQGSAARSVAFAELTANDTAGPADEAGRMLTIASVSNAVGGTVQIVGGAVVFTQDGSFSGTASFEYTLQDNGTTGGAPAPLTDIGRVTFEVAPGAFARPVDFNADGRDDQLWRNADGSLSSWVSGGAAVTIGSAALSTRTEGTGDFNGDGRGDILFHTADRHVVTWLMNGTQLTSISDLGSTSPGWHIRGTGDFNGNGNGTDDILLHNDSGQVAIWQIVNGQLSAIQVAGSAASSWHIAGTADFNGDGRDDILWRNNSGEVAAWLMNSNGQPGSIASLGSAPISSHIAATGDFNGDGRDDILWRNDNGQVAAWLMNGAALGSISTVGSATPAWHIVGTGDLNANGTEDMIWRSDNGQVVGWLLNGGTLAAVQDLGGTPPTTHIVGSHFDIV